jgi:hypothetical protein
MAICKTNGALVRSEVFIAAYKIGVGLTPLGDAGAAIPDD